MIFCFNCRTNTVQVPTFAFGDTSVTVAACDDCRKATGMVGATVKMSYFASGALDIPSTVTMHRDGLVAFTG